MRSRQIELKSIFLVIGILFAIFLAIPIVMMLFKAFQQNGVISVQNFVDVLTGNNFFKALGNSFLVSAATGVITVLLAFLLAYAVNMTNLPSWLKKLFRGGAMLPMLLPTITYGFAIIYSFGKQGLITRLFGGQLFEIYGFQGLLLGYTIYTLPTAFMLINNTFQFIDKKFITVSKVMGDSPLRSFFVTIVRPLLGTLGAAFIQCFFLSFTDFGIPASVGGKYDVVATVLYNQMLGSVPDFGRGAVIALMMLLPSVLSIFILHLLEKSNIRYSKVSLYECKKNRLRDSVFGVVSAAVLLSLLAIFAVIFVIPFVSDWPYNLSFTFEKALGVLQDQQLFGTFRNSLWVAGCTAFFGTIIAYGAALVSARSDLSKRCKGIVDGIALVTNTIPGMVLGVAFLFVFSGTPLQNTFALIILCNIVHYFSTPYLMMKNSLSKMNAGWETTGRLMGDNWFKTVARVVTPNAFSTLLEIFSYYFVNAMVTVSAVIFIFGARTSVITTKIKELQHYTKFDEIFVLSLLIFFTNILVKLIISFCTRKKGASV